MKNKLLSLYNKYEEYINYFIVGVCTTFVSLASKYILLFTILSSKNAFELQLAVIISWVLAVTFAYFTNRKYVFKSREKNIISEMTMFFMARVSTLFLESLILWFFITYLKLNSDIYVIIWTLMSQVIIFVGNYILSKFLIFNQNKQIINKTNSYVFILCILFIILCYMFPYTHDDWAWGSQIGIIRLKTLFADYNGRWLGNIFVLLLTRNRLIKAIIMLLVALGIIKYSYKITDSKKDFSKYTLILLLLVMPLSVFKEGFVWTSGFTNYTMVILLILIYLNYNKKIILDNKKEYSNKIIIPFFILGASSSLFMENITIYNLLISVFMVVFIKFYKKYFSKINISYCIGCIIGTIIMFSNGAYINILNNQDGYRSIKGTNVINNIISTYEQTISKYMILENHFINIFVGVICLYLIYKYLQKNKFVKNTKKIIFNFISITICAILAFEFYKLFINNNIIMSTIPNNIIVWFYTYYWISIFILIILIIDNSDTKTKLLFELISILLIVGPLLVVNPIGPRCFLPTYVFFTLFSIELFNYAFYYEIKMIKNMNYIKIVVFIILSINLVIYGMIYFVDYKRIEIIKNNKEKNELVLPLIPYEDYTQYPNPVNELFLERYKLFYGIEENVNIIFKPYEKQ